jgi:hypothetical protein
MSATVELPALLGMLLAELTLFAVGHGIDPAGINAQADQEFLCGIRTAIAKRQVVFFGSAFISVTFKGDADPGPFGQSAGIGRQSLPRIFADAVLVVIEKGILDA